MNAFEKAKALFAAAVAVASGMAGGKAEARMPGRWTGSLGAPRHAGARKVAWDQRDARKRRNVLRNRLAHR